MRGIRLGSWVILLGVVLTFATQLFFIVARQVLELGLTTSHDWFMTCSEVTNLAELGLTVVIVVGMASCALASKGRARRGFATAAILIFVAQALFYLPWLLSQVVDFSLDVVLWIMRAFFLVALAGSFAYSVAVRELASHRALVRAFQIALAAQVVIRVLSLAFAEVSLDRPTAILQIAETAVYTVRPIAWLYLVLDVLGAFAEGGALPMATVRALPRRVASAVAIGLCVFGTALAAFAWWGTRLISSASTTDLTLVIGVAMFVIGAFALARMRRRVPIAVPCVATGVLLTAALLVTRTNVTPLEQVQLVPVDVPGLAISLPDGHVKRDIFSQELGRLTSTTYHSDIGLVTMSWTLARRSPVEDLGSVHVSQVDNLPFTEHVHGLEIHGVVFAARNIAELHATWKCPDDPRWFKLEVSRYDEGVDVLRGVGRRIFDTITCGGATKAPGFALAFEPPAGYVAKPPGQRMRWANGGEGITFYCSADANYVDALATNPGSLLTVVKWEQHAGDVAWLPDEMLAKRGHIVESDTRKVAEVVEGDYRVLITAWRCWGLEIDVLGVWTGRASLPRNAALAALRSARCPE